MGSTGTTALVDISDVFCGFLMVSQQGRLFALERLEATPALDRFVPRPCEVSMDGLDPLIVRLRPSPMALVVHPGEPPHNYFLTSFSTGGQSRRMKVSLTTSEVVMDSLKAGGWPMLHVGELQRAAAAARDNSTNLSVPVRQAELRQNLPASWVDALHGVFVANLEPPEDKAGQLADHVDRLRAAINRTMVDGWLGHCLWLDPESGLIGRALPNREHTGFINVTSDELGVLDFRSVLARDEVGILLRTEGVANVLPVLRHGSSWTGPTLQVYDAAFRATHGVDEFHSLYRGLRKLAAVGAPVLEFRRGPLGRNIAVSLLTPAAAPESRQAMAVRKFPLRHLLWQTRQPGAWR